MEEEINDMDAKVVYERMRDTWRSIKAERELQREQNKYFYKGKRFLSWFLDIHPISFVELEPTEIL